MATWIMASRDPEAYYGTALASTPPHMEEYEVGWVAATSRWRLDSCFNTKEQRHQSRAQFTSTIVPGGHWGARRGGGTG